MDFQGLSRPWVKTRFHHIRKDFSIIKTGDNIFSRQNFVWLQNTAMRKKIFSHEFLIP